MAGSREGRIYMMPEVKRVEEEIERVVYLCLGRGDEGFAGTDEGEGLFNCKKRSDASEDSEGESM